MFHSRHNEVKQQGAIEAAQNPDSNVTSQQAEQAIVDETKKAGGAAYQFDPNATAEEKAAQARSRVDPNFHHERKPGATGVVSDVDDGQTAGYDLPTPTTEGALEVTDANGKGGGSSGSKEDERWARDRVGWAPRFGQGDPADDAGPTHLDHSTWVEEHLDDKFFGDWYHNTGIIAFACIMTYITTMFGGGLAFVFIIGGICSVYYRTSIRRVRRNCRDDIRREMAKTKLETDHESLEWINSFMVKFWPIFAPPLCESIINSVDQVLSTSTPAFLDSLRMKTFVLGTKPPRLEHVKTYPKSEDNIVLMDWKFSFNPNDVADLTSRQLKNKINPKVVLEVRVGKGMISKGLDVIVEDFAFSGIMRVKMKLQIPFPHVEKAEICFLGRPEIDYVCKPLGGDMFGFDINFIPGLEGFILEQIHGNLEPIMYDPHVFPIEIAKIMAGSAVETAIGVVQITLHGGQGLKNADKFSGNPDPYALVSINGRDTVGKTKTIHETGNPRWNETINVIVTSLKDSLTVSVHDYNEYRKDKQLGVATFALERLEAETVHENMHIEVMEGGKARGIIQADVRFFPVIEGEKLPDGTASAVPESNTGIAKFTVEQAKELDGSKSMIGQLNPYAVLLLNGKEVQISQKLKRTNNPIWPNATKELLITDRKSAKLGLVIKDDRDIAADPILGTYQVKLNDMIELMGKGQEWYHLAGAGSARAKMTLQWKPVALKGSSSGSGGYITPIGVMRLHFQNARELRNLETMGKSDPYVRVLLSGIDRGRTVTHENTLDPDFNEVIYVPVHSNREKLTLEVMDQESLGKDRSLGMMEVAVSEYIRQAENGEYLAHGEKRVRTEPLRLSGKGSSKGLLNFTCAFYPTENVADPDDEEDEEQLAAEGDVKKSIEETRASAERVRSERSGTISSMHKPTKSEAAHDDMLKKLNEGETDQQETEDVKQAVAPKIKLDKEHLSQYESGLLIFRVIDMDLAHANGHLEILMDDMLFPAWRSSRIRSRNTTLNETGDAMVRELDFSRITIRLREKANNDDGQDDTYAKLTGQTLDVLMRHLYTTWTLTMKGKDGRDNHISLQIKYLPIKMQLDPSESINNMGTLRCEILDAADLPAADRNGYSDPYCKFQLNGRQVYKSETQKKTLHPAWNEFFETNIPSRTAAQFKVEVWDWDRGDKDDLLGTSAINLDVLEPFEPQEVTLGLDGKSGAIRLKMLFKPEYVTRAKIGSSTFSGTFAVPGKIVGAPVKGVGKGAVFVGGNVMRAATFAGRGFRKRKTESGTVVEEPIPDGASPPNGNKPNVIDSYPPSSAPKIIAPGSPPATPSSHSRQRSGDQSLLGASRSPGGEFGTATITVLSASGFEGDNISVMIKQPQGKTSKTVHKTEKIKSSQEGGLHWHEQTESFKVQCPVDQQFAVQVKDMHTFGRDIDLGEGTLPLTLGKQEITCGGGTVTIQTGFQQASQMDGASIAGSTTSPYSKRKTWLPGRSSRDVTSRAVSGAPSDSAA